MGRLTVFVKDGPELAGDYVTNNAGERVYQLRQTPLDKELYIRVDRTPGVAATDYLLTADIRAGVGEVPPTISGTLADATRSAFVSVFIRKSQLFSLDLSSASVVGGPTRRGG